MLLIGPNGRAWTRDSQGTKHFNFEIALWRCSFANFIEEATEAGEFGIIEEDAHLDLDVSMKKGPLE